MWFKRRIAPQPFLVFLLFSSLLESVSDKWVYYSFHARSTSYGFLYFELKNGNLLPILLSIIGTGSAASLIGTPFAYQLDKQTLVSTDENSENITTKCAISIKFLCDK